jgi:hypothetical protein
MLGRRFACSRGGCDQAGRRDRPRPVVGATGKVERGDPAPRRRRHPQVRELPVKHLSSRRWRPARRGEQATRPSAPLGPTISRPRPRAVLRGARWAGAAGARPCDPGARVPRGGRQPRAGAGQRCEEGRLAASARARAGRRGGRTCPPDGWGGHFLPQRCREDNSLPARPAGMPTQAVTQLALSQARRAEARRYAVRRREARSLRARLTALLARAR